jgi:hypothetical protein
MYSDPNLRSRGLQGFGLGSGVCVRHNPDVFRTLVQNSGDVVNARQGAGKNKNFASYRANVTEPRRLGERANGHLCVRV